jgi:hypothetical protein
VRTLANIRGPCSVWRCSGGNRRMSTHSTFSCSPAAAVAHRREHLPQCQQGWFCAAENSCRSASSSHLEHAPHHSLALGASPGTGMLHQLGEAVVAHKRTVPEKPTGSMCVCRGSGVSRASSRVARVAYGAQHWPQQRSWHVGALGLSIIAVCDRCSL